MNDRITNGDIQIIHKSTLDMIADYFTKAIQGQHFRDLRRMLMNG
eukprot:gene24954-45869_t